jgi:hypothetical protein
MALSVKLYRVVGKGKDRRYVPIDLGRREGRSKEAVCRRRMCPLSPGNVCSPPRAPYRCSVSPRTGQKPRK